MAPDRDRVQHRPGLGRRHFLRGLAVLGTVLALPSQRLEAATLPLEQRLQLCQPPGDPLQELLRRNREFAAVWAEAGPVARVIMGQVGSSFRWKTT